MITCLSGSVEDLHVGLSSIESPISTRSQKPVKFQQMCSCGLCTTYSLEKDNVDECHLPCAEKYVQPWDMMSSFCACDATTK